MLICLKIKKHQIQNKMKKAALILLSIVIIAGCHHSTNPTPSQTTPPPTTSSNIPANVTAVCGAWIQDSTAVWKVRQTSYTTADTTWSSSMYYSNPANYYLTISSNSYTLVTSMETVVGYEFQGITPDGTQGNGVWKISGDSIYFPGTNKPINQQLYYSIEKETAHSLVFTTRALCSTQGTAMSGFNKYYYHK